MTIAIHSFRITAIAVLTVLVTQCFSQPLQAQDVNIETSSEDSTWHDWNVRIAPYFWLIGIKGQISVNPEPVQLPIIPPPVEQLPAGYSVYDIDIGFQEVLTSLKFALMLSGQFNIQRFVTQFNVSSIVLESNAIAPFNYLFQNNTLRFAYAGGDLGAGYRVVRSRKFMMDLLLGLKFVYSGVDLTTELSGRKPLTGSVSKTWVDPVLCTNISYRPLKWLELVAYGDLGPTLYNNKLTYQFASQANFLITKRLYLSAGYRNYFVSAPLEETSFSGRLAGLLVKVGVQF